eukprot:1152508-Pelagomonas_calceolata.AAC.1
MDSINHIALRSLNPTMNERMHTNTFIPVGAMLPLAPVSKPSTKADMTHPLLVWMPAKMRDPLSGAYKFLKTSPELSLTGFSYWYRLLCPTSKLLQLAYQVQQSPSKKGSPC